MSTITRAELEQLYNTHTVAEVARQLGVCRQTVYERLREFGIPLKEPKGCLKVVSDGVGLPMRLSD